MAESPYPPYIPLRTIVWGRALQMETTRPLRIETETRASRSLVWAETAEPFFPAGEVRTPPVGVEAVIEVPSTYLAGWVDPATGDPVDPTAGPTHTYTTRVRVFDGDRLVNDYEVGPYVVPAGITPLDGELLRFLGLAPSPLTSAALWDLTGLDDFPPGAAVGDWGVDFTPFTKPNGDTVIRFFRKD
ncbi:hypothetical protein [Microbacterium sp. CFBP 8794]|uniref:hypothetical protein n=1 Tax=Microbacterium sp. CFBP 8794 TaxID=2775269 RepID=UPI001786E31A|nr:hypothetical protein [Microbacterium sp. CFBP 8794]MBD8477550.1 hypothetical protein [Microbacterium sp. CFBP 8794]